MIDYELKHGSHGSPQEGLCAMEWVAYLAGEKHSDSPECVDPVLRCFSIGLNDHLPSDLRQQLRPYLARMIGTADDGRTTERRYAVADWAIREAAPLAQEAIKRPDLAEKLRAIPTVKDRASAKRAKKVAREVAAAAAADAYADAYAAAYAAAAAAAADAAYAADAADYAADAADAAAKRQTWERLLPSALALLDRLLPTEAIALPERAQAEYTRLMEVAV